MVYTVHVPSGPAGPEAGITIRDDRGVPATQLAMPEPIDRPEAAEELLERAGWAPSAAWTGTDEGWTAPVVQV